tara:strand:- start:157 stop:690 length:534 start_codon:yes stop_codon:yes gene_type:complete
MSLTSELEAAFERANLEVDGAPPVDNAYVEAYAKFQAEAIVNFLTQCEFRITKLNAPVVVENFKIPEQLVNVATETLLGEYGPLLKTLKKIAEPLGLGETIDSLEGEIKKAIANVAEGGATAVGLDLGKDVGGLESTGYVYIGEDPDSQGGFNVEDEDGQKDFTTVKLFKEDIENLI